VKLWNYFEKVEGAKASGGMAAGGPVLLAAHAATKNPAHAVHPNLR